MNRLKTDAILVAEDDKSLQFIAKKQLERLGYVAEIVENGQLALEAASKTEYALILMDLHMPILNGVQAAHAIRAYETDGQLTLTPIVAMTADPDRTKSTDAGMQGYLRKPVLLKELERTVLNHLRK